MLIFSLDVTQCFVTRAQQRVSLPLPPFFLPSPLTLENHCGGPLTLVIYACFLNARLREKTKHLEPKSIKKRTGLDDIEERGSKLGLLVLELVDDLLRQVLLQQRLAVGGGLQ